MPWLTRQQRHTLASLALTCDSVDESTLREIIARSDAYTPPAPVLTEEEREAIRAAERVLSCKAIILSNERWCDFGKALDNLLARTATKQSAADAAGGK